MPVPTALGNTPFRKLEKHFKSRAVKGRVPSLRKYPVVDVSRPALADDDPVWRAGWWAPDNDIEPDLYPDGNLKRRDKGKARDLGERPGEIPVGLNVKEIRLSSGEIGYIVAEGCIIIPGYINEKQQLDLLESALAEYTLPPNPLSLSTHYDLPPNLFELYLAQSPTLIHPLFEMFDPAQQDIIRTALAARNSRTVNEVESGQMLGVEEILSRHKAWKGDMPAEGLGPKTAEELMGELRWANLGLIYKMYDLEPANAIPFPPELAEMCREVIREVKWSDVFSEEDQKRLGADTWSTDYDTGIVNFYNLKDTLMGHVDRAELDPYRPLVSISYVPPPTTLTLRLGHSAVFLLGSNTRDVQPTPIILRSGDVIIMSGKGRENYHGIPRIMEGTLPVLFQPCDGDSARLSAAKRWISTGRININARQVFPPGMDRSRAMHGG